jgi:hypothetical protein
MSMPCGVGFDNQRQCIGPSRMRVKAHSSAEPSRCGQNAGYQLSRDQLPSSRDAQFG